MKRVLATAVVACSSLHLAPSHASSAGWGAPGSTAGGAGGAWPSFPAEDPPSRPPQGSQTDQPPVDPANYNNNNIPPGNLNAPAAANGAAATGYHDPSTYHQHPQQQQQQQERQPQPPPPYGSPYVPQHSRWAGQQQYPPNQQQQHQQHVNGQFPQRNERYLPPAPGDGNGEPLHLGTRWRGLVSRVKDAVLPGQPPPPHYGGQDGGGYHYGGGGGGWAEGAGGYSPPRSPWESGVDQNTGYSSPPVGSGGQAQQASIDGFGGGYEQQQQSAFPGPPAPGYDPPPEVAQQQGGYPLGGGSAAASTDASFDNRQGQQHPTSPPPPFFDPQAPPPVPPQDDGGGGGSSSGYGNEPRSAGVYGDGSIGGDTVVDTFGAATVPEGRYGAAGSGGSEPSFEPPQAGAASVGQGWSMPGVDAVPAREEPAAEGGEEDDAGKAGSTTATVPADPQGGGVSGSGSTAAAAAAAWPGVDNADATAPSESRAGGSEPMVGTEAFDSSSVGGVSLRSNEGDGALDTMPSSADHGKEEVDWGTGVEEDGDEEGKGAEGESGETVEVPGSEEKLQLESEEKALIRELERMDNTIGNGDDLPSIGSERPRVIGDGGSGVSTLSPTTPPPLPPPPSSEHQAMIDREVEHQLDDLFDSIILDDADDPDAEGGEYPLPSEAAVVGSGGVPGQGWGSLVDDHEEDAVDAVREQPAARPTQAADQTRRTPSSHGDASVHAGADARARDGGSTPGGAPPGAASTAAMAGKEEEGEPPVAAEATALAEVGSVAGAGSAGSLWGNTRRWETLPPQPDAATSDPVVVLVEEEEDEEEVEEEEEEEEEEKDLEDESDVRVLLDPIELPPSAASDEIWNDQHLQDQLDAYWEQSRRGGAGAGAAAAAGGKQLSAYGGGGGAPHYGPGDWVGGNGGGAALLPEPLPGSAADGAARTSGWVASPRLFDGGSQSPINIYGNVHVHLQQGGAQDGGDQQQQQQQQQKQQPSPSSELSARERYYSQGETSWSGSERGGQ